MSTGTATWEEIKISVKQIDKAKLVLMHCVSAYPCDPTNANITKIEKLNLLAMKENN